MVVLQAPETELSGVNTDGMCCTCQWVNAPLSTGRPLAHLIIFAFTISINYISKRGVGKYNLVLI